MDCSRNSIGQDAYVSDTLEDRAVVRADRSQPTIAHHPIHALLVPVPIACFGGALITDIAYWSSLNVQWVNFSSWLLFAGLVVAFFAVVAGFIDLWREPQLFRGHVGWLYGAGNALGLILAIGDAFVHSRDGYTSVVPSGITLSALAFLLLVISQWLAGDMFHRRYAVRPIETEAA